MIFPPERSARLIEVQLEDVATPAWLLNQSLAARSLLRLYQ